MAEVNLSINGKSYPILCDDGQEARIQQLAGYIDQRLQDILQSGAATNDNHLLVLTSLILADEIFDLRDGAGPSLNGVDEDSVAEALRSMASRISLVSERLKSL